MKFTFVTLFQNIVEGYFQDSILKRAIDKDILHVDYLNPRDFSKSKHNKVDDTAVGGGAGMVMNPQPLYDSLDALKSEDEDVHIVFLTPVAKPFRQNDAKRLAKKKNVVFVSGRYEGIDERIIETDVDEEWSIGDYVLSGGELAAMVIIDALIRLIPGALGHAEAAEQDSFVEGILDCPHYSRPEIVDGQRVPDVLLSGDHKAIQDWRRKQALGKTWLKRPELMEDLSLSETDKDLLKEFIAHYKSENTY